MAIIILLGSTMAYMLFRLYQTSNLLVESTRKAFTLETNNKATVLENFFRRRRQEVATFCKNGIFETYFRGSALGVIPPQGIEVITAPIWQLLITRLEFQELGRPVYGSAAFYDVSRSRIVARTDEAARNQWINEPLFQLLKNQMAGDVSFGSSCDGSACHVFVIGVVRHGAEPRGLLLLELSTEATWGLIQHLGTEATHNFTGLAEADGKFIFGPGELSLTTVQHVFGTQLQNLEATGTITQLQLRDSGKTTVLIASRKISETGFFLVHVVPGTALFESHSTILWPVVLVLLMGSLVLMLIYMFMTTAQRHVMYQQLQEAHDGLEYRVKVRTSELEDLNDTLREEIIERRKAEEALRQATQELQETNRELKDFAHVVSHDLKAPLRAVGKLTHWLATDYEQALDDEGKRQMKLLQDRVKGMHNLIDGVLQYSRIGRIREQLGVVDLNQVLREVLDSLDPPSHITIVVENDLPSVRGEETRLHEVFQNLLDNAVKYMDKPQGEIRISCTDKNGLWQFAVRDNGPGIDSIHFERIFQMFQTLKSKKKTESTGIGLALVKKIVELHGGTVWVESTLGVGTAFLFTLPHEGVKT
ncbi:MAG: ATP-binding protein [Thermodesulfobacteriota bacterium]